MRHSSSSGRGLRSAAVASLVLSAQLASPARGTAQSNITPLCFGASLCPCNNPAPQPESGCMNSFAQGGKLTGSGDTVVSNDTLALHVSGVPTSTTVFFFQADQLVNGGSGTVFGDGLKCIQGVRWWRLGARQAVAGQTAIGFGTPLGPEISVRGSIAPAGELMRYQAYYRNAAAFCTPDGFNLTNAVEVLWVP